MSSNLSANCNCRSVSDTHTDKQDINGFVSYNILLLAYKV